MPAPRLYLVTPQVLDSAGLEALATLLDGFDIACIRLAVAGGDAEVRRAGEALLGLRAGRDVSLVVADHFRLVSALRFDGVHLADGPRHVREARKVLGPDAVVGAHCGASRHDGMTAAEIGADYVAFGPVAPTPLGAGTVAPAELFAWWAEMIETPVVAEGGVTPDLAEALAPHVDFLALGDELWSHPRGAPAGLAEIVARLPQD